MNMKKTIAALALSTSAAFALTPPPSETKTICLQTHENAQGASYASNCDSAPNNLTLQLPILENGCAAGQTALTARKFFHTGEFDIQIHSCLPPGVVQL